MAAIRDELASIPAAPPHAPIESAFARRGGWAGLARWIFGWIRTRGRIPARFVLIAAAIATIVVLGSHLLALAARDRMLGQEIAGPPARSIIEGGEVDPASPVDHDVRRAHLAGDHLVLEHDDSNISVLRRGYRTAEAGAAVAWADRSRRAVLDPVIASGFVEAMLQIDPWLTAGRFAPRPVGSRRDCRDCPTMTILSAGWIDAGEVMWRRASGAPARRFVSSPALAIAREPFVLVPCAWHTPPCANLPDDSETGRTLIAAPDSNPQIARLLADKRYRLLTASEAARFASLAARDPRVGARLTFATSEWVCDLAASGLPAGCSIRPNGDAPAASPFAAVRLVRPACCDPVAAPLDDRVTPRRSAS